MTHQTRPAEPLGEPPRRSLAATLVPAAVLLLTVALIGYSAWPNLQPLPSVRVSQALFDRSAEAAAEPVTATQPSPDPAEAPSKPPHSGEPVQAPGWLEARPFYFAASALADGVVERIEVLEGERVEAGQVVARLVDEDAELALRRAEAELAAAEGRLAERRAELRAAEAHWQDPIELTRAVSVGEAALAEAEAELARLPSLIAEAEALAEQRQEELTRTLRMEKSQAVAELEAIVARKQAASSRARVDALTARRPVLEARVRRLEAELEAARRDLELRIELRRRLAAAKAAVDLAEAELERAKAARDEAALRLERMAVRAPIAGYVQKRLKRVGDKVIQRMEGQHSAHVVHVYDPKRLQVRVDVPLADARNVFAGQRCEVVVDVLPNRTFAGEVLRTTHEADLQKNTLEVQVAVTDPDPLLRPEMLARVTFLPPEAEVGDGGQPLASATQPAGNRLRVPRAALREGPSGSRVWSVVQRRGERGVVQPVAVQRLGEEGDWVTVRGPLHAGALLVVDEGGVMQGLRAGQRVRIRPAGDMNETAVSGEAGSRAAG